jgi:hypothetical protein
MAPEFNLMDENGFSVRLKDFWVKNCCLIFLPQKLYLWLLQSTEIKKQENPHLLFVMGSLPKKSRLFISKDLFN